MPTSRATIILYFDVVNSLYQIEIKYSSVFINLGFDLSVNLRLPPFPPGTGTPSSLRDTPSNRGNYLSGEANLALLKGELSRSD